MHCIIIYIMYYIILCIILCYKHRTFTLSPPPQYKQLFGCITKPNRRCYTEHNQPTNKMAAFTYRDPFSPPSGALFTCFKNTVFQLSVLFACLRRKVSLVRTEGN